MTIRDIRPASLRLAILILLAIPFFSYRPFSLVADSATSFPFFLTWLLYTGIVSVLIIHSVGLDEWARWFGFACLLVLITIGTAVIWLGIRDWLGFPSEEADGTTYTQEEWSRDLFTKGLAIISTVPFAIFAINCFSVASFAARVARWRGRVRGAGEHGLVALRTLQHITEVFPELILTWREEHPSIVSPRHKATMRGGLGRVVDSVVWAAAGVGHWTLAVLVFSFEPIPIYCHSIELHFQSRS